jgi:hypothetical protein
MRELARVTDRSVSARSAALGALVDSIAEKDAEYAADAADADAFDDAEHARQWLAQIRAMPGPQQDEELKKIGFRSLRHLRRAVDAKKPVKELPAYLFFALKRCEAQVRQRNEVPAQQNTVVLMAAPPRDFERDDDVIDIPMDKVR